MNQVIARTIAGVLLICAVVLAGAAVSPGTSVGAALFPTGKPVYIIVTMTPALAVEQASATPAEQASATPAEQASATPAEQPTSATPAEQPTSATLANLAQGAPADAGQGAPADAGQGAPADAGQGAPADAGQGAPADAGQGAPVEQHPTCAPGVESAYCQLPILQVTNDNPAPAGRTMTPAEIEYSNRRSR